MDDAEWKQANIHMQCGSSKTPERCLQKCWRGEIRDHKGRANSPFMQRECQGIPCWVLLVTTEILGYGTE